MPTKSRRVNEVWDIVWRSMPKGLYIEELASTLNLPLLKASDLLGMYREIPTVSRKDRKIRINPVTASIQSFKTSYESDVFFSSKKGVKEHFSSSRIPNTDKWRCIYVKPDYTITSWDSDSLEIAKKRVNSLSREFWSNIGVKWRTQLNHNSNPIYRPV